VLAIGCLAFAPAALAEGGLPGVSVGTTATLETEVAPSATATVTVSTETVSVTATASTTEPPRTVVRTAAPGPDHARSTSRAHAPTHASASAAPPRTPVPSPGAPLGASGQTSIAPLALLLVGLTGRLLALAPPHSGRRLQLPGTPSRSSPAPLALERPG
jgi:hypothetical protein